MNHIEKAYKAWRATVKDGARATRRKRTPEQREKMRRAALKRWAKARRSA
jgi:glutathione synthase/RimK-type ligase-like ATP-grasp enzyme